MEGSRCVSIPKCERFVLEKGTGMSRRFEISEYVVATLAGSPWLIVHIFIYEQHTDANEPDRRVPSPNVRRPGIVSYCEPPLLVSSSSRTGSPPTATHRVEHTERASIFTNGKKNKQRRQPEPQHKPQGPKKRTHKRLFGVCCEHTRPGKQLAERSRRPHRKQISLSSFSLFLKSSHHTPSLGKNLPDIGKTPTLRTPPCPTLLRESCRSSSAPCPSRRVPTLPYPRRKSPRLSRPRR